MQTPDRYALALLIAIPMVLGLSARLAFISGYGEGHKNAIAEWQHPRQPVLFVYAPPVILPDFVRSPGCLP